MDCFEKKIFAENIFIDHMTVISCKEHDLDRIFTYFTMKLSYF